MRLALLVVTAITAVGGCSLSLGASSPGDPVAVDASIADAAPVGRSGCWENDSRVSCSYSTRSVRALLVDRDVHYAVPLGPAPSSGWPVVFYFQGSFVPAADAFSADRGESFGRYQLTRTIAALLDAGYAIVAPDASLGGTTAWQTNIPPWDVLWSTSSDDAFLRAIFDVIDDGKLGALDRDRWFAMGISSGGFMTSRMAVSYPGRFRALAIHSGSYALCSALCVVPRPLPADHPPTLFLHGSEDAVVPVSAMAPYRDALMAEGHRVKALLQQGAGHEWIEEGISEIPSWFDTLP